MAQSKSITDILAKELGYKDKTELKKVIKERGGTPSAREKRQRDTLMGGVIGKLEEGEGFRSAFSASAKEQVEGFKEKFSKKGLKKFARKAYRTAFAGEDIFSAYMRGRLRKKEKKELEEAGIEEGEGKGEESPTKLGGDSEVYLKIIAKESIAIPAMARDVNVMRQNLQKLVKLWGGKAATGKEVDVGNNEKLPQEEIDKIRAEVYAKKEGTKERAEDVNFFEEQDKIEAEQEAGRKKDKGATAETTPTPEKKEGEGGFLDNIIQFFSNGFMNAIKSLFNPKTLMNIFKKVFLPIAIIGTLFSGIMAGFKKYQETGSLTDALVAGLGGALSFVTFGIFGEDTLKSMFDAISDFFSPITDTISKVFNGIKDFVKNIFGGIAGDVKEETPTEMQKIKPQMPGGGEKMVSDMATAAGAPEGLIPDMKGVLDAGQKGGFNAMVEKAKELEKKYPSQQPATETTPTPMTKEGIPLDQAQRNYELNKQLTGEASKIFGTDFKMPEAPMPSSTPTAVAPTPSPKASNEDKIKEYESHIESNKKRFARREEGAKRHIESFKKRYKNDPERVKELEDEYAATLKTEKAEMEEANKKFQNEIDVLKKSPSQSSPTAQSIPQTPATMPTEAQGGGSSATGTPAPDMKPPSISGSEISSASSQVAEGQRMESSADQGSVVNAPVNNTSTGSIGGNIRPPSADVWNSDFAKMLAAT